MTTMSYSPVDGGAPRVFSPRENDIFISYAQPDLGFVKRLDAAIRQLGRIPLVDWDIQLGAAEWADVRAGINEVESFVFVISPASAASSRNQNELELASQLNKQIIPILWEPVEPENLPTLLKDQRLIQVRRGTTVSFEKLARRIVYIHTHARLDRRAKEWAEQQKSPELLLSSSDVDAINALKNQTSHKGFDLLLSRLTPLQTEFLEASRQAQLADQAPEQLELFLSYSRRDKEFVRQIYNKLKEKNKTPWIDYVNIPVAADWQEEIYRGIEEAHTLLFVMSHRSLDSENCLKELVHAVFRKRRVISIIFLQNPERAAAQTVDAYQTELIQKLEQLEQGKLKTELKKKYHQSGLYYQTEQEQDEHPISKLQTVLFGSQEQFEQDTSELWKAISNNLKLMQEVANFERKAREWHQHNRDREWLELSFRQLREAKRLLKQAKEENVNTTVLLHEYIQANCRAKQEGFLGLALLGAGVLTLLGFLGFGFTQANVGEIKALVSSLEGKQQLDALIVGLRAGKKLKDAPWQSKLVQEPDLPVRTITALQQEINNLREINRLSRHEGRVFQVSFSPDGQMLASASADDTVRLWKADGTPIGNPLLGHQDDVVSLAFNPGRVVGPEGVKHFRLASGSYDRTIKLWEIKQYPDGAIQTKLFKTLINNGHQDKVLSLTSAPGGTILASASADGTIKLWNWQSGDLLVTLRHAKPGTIVTGVSFSPYSREIATSGYDKTVKLWAPTGELLATLPHTAPVSTVSFSPDGTFLVSGDVQGTLKLWRKDGTEIASLSKHEGAIYRIAFNPSNKQMFASASGDGTVRVWQGKELLYTLRGHQGPVYRVQFSPDGQTIATAGADGTVKLWSLEDGTLLDSLEGHRDEVLSIEFSPERQQERMIASSSADSTIRIWKLDSPVVTFPHNNRVYDVSFRPNDKMFASGGWQTIRLWSQDGTLTSINKAHDSIVNSIRFSPDGSILASAGAEAEPVGKNSIKTVNTIKLWRLSGNRLMRLRTLKGHNNVVNNIEFVPNARLLASVSEDRTVKFWSYPEGQLVQTIDAKGALTSLSFNRDGTLMVTTSKASGSSPGAVKLWKLHFDRSGLHSVELLKTVDQQDDADFLTAAFSPDGQRFATAGTDASVRLWTVDGLAIGEPLKGHTKPITKISFSPNGALLASASQDGKIKLWTSNGSLITTLNKHTREVSSLSFSSNSRALISSSYDNRVLLWTLPDFEDFEANPSVVLGKFLAQGCDAARNFLNQTSEVRQESDDNSSQKETDEVRKFCTEEYPPKPSPSIVSYWGRRADMPFDSN